MKPLFLLPGLATFVLAAPSAQAEQPASFDAGRYTRVLAVPERHQIEPLQTIVSVEFPRQEIVTVGDAAAYLLRRTGYSMLSPAPKKRADHARVLAFSLPEVQRRFDGVTITAALEALAGAAYRPVINHASRTVHFEARDAVGQRSKRRNQRT